ncbi:MAG TPA: hypothetical protein VGP94_13245 [Tepidisphaeraceae bacterium]|jgi:hypothetical protein|nr:hypothetical protein [Tepidisphaeraceae bacterium]
MIIRRDIFITNVRYREDEANDLLQGFIFMGDMSRPRVPRGIDPGYVAKFIRLNVKIDSGPDAYNKSLHCIRFYERPDAALHLALTLTGQERSIREIRRSCYALQAVGDFGKADDLTKMADYFDRSVVPRGDASKDFPLLYETLEALAPSGAPDRLNARLMADLGAAAKEQNKNEANATAHDKLSAVNRNVRPGAEARIAGKRKLQAMDADARRPELVKIYMSNSPLMDDYMEVWAGRMLRLDAMTGKRDAVYGEFEKAIDTAAKLPEAQRGFYIIRAAQAIVYLQGDLKPHHEKLYLDAQGGGMNFLWDDVNYKVLPKVNVPVIPDPPAAGTKTK